MKIRLRGIAAVADAYTHDHPEGKIYSRRALPTHAEVPLYVCGTEQQATSIFVTLERVGGYLTLDCRLLDSDDEAEWLIDNVISGWHALSLKTYDHEGYRVPDARGFHIDEMTIAGVEVDALASCDLCFCWIEEDGRINYELPKSVWYAIEEFYEVTRKPEPVVKFINFFAESEQMNPPEQVPQGPIQGDGIHFLKLVRSQGQVDLLICNQGILVGKVRAGPALIQSLRDMLDHYDQVFPQLRCGYQDDLTDEDEPAEAGDVQ